MYKPHGATSRRSWIRSFKLIATVVGLLVATTLFSPPATASTPPSFSGCYPVDDGTPYRTQDQYGSYVQAIIKYRCNTGKEYQFLGSLYQDVDSQGGDYVASRYHEGVDTAPYLFAGYGRCSSTRSTRFDIVYHLTILTVSKYYTTSAVWLNCHY